MYQLRRAMQQPFFLFYFFIHLSSNAKKGEHKTSMFMPVSPLYFFFFCNLFMQTIRRNLFSMLKIKSRNCGIVFNLFVLHFCLTFIHINKAPFFPWVVGYFCLVSFCLSSYPSHQLYPKRENHCPRVHYVCPALFFSLLWPLEITLHACLTAHNAGFLQYERMF